MKLCMTVLSLLVLVAAFCSPARLPQEDSKRPIACCFTYTLRKLPLSFLKGYYETCRRRCPKPGVVFQTKRGKQICANPSVPWVQKYMEHLELNPATPRTGPGNLQEMVP